jgi:hypothetical protein
MVTFAVEGQAFASVTVTVYVPAANAVAVAVVCAGVVFHEYVYAPVPPVAAAVAEPAAAPKHALFVDAEIDATRAAGCVIVKPVYETGQLLASVIVTA